MTKRKIIFCLLQLCLISSFAQKSDQAGAGNLAYIDPRIGNVGALLVPTRPTVQLPNQLIRMYPQRQDYISDQISSFPLNIVSHRLGEVFSVKPSVKAPAIADWNEQQTYDHDLEVTRPWYYSTYLVDKDVQVEFAPAAKTGIYRFTFPANGTKALLFSNYNKDASAYALVNGNVLTGTERYHGNIKVYLYGEFSAAATLQVVDGKNIVKQDSVRGDIVKAAVVFSNNAPASIELRYAISYVSAEQAKKNFTKEIAKASFDNVVKQAAQSWQKVIDQIQVEGGTDAQRRSFYTALYRCYERMVNISEDSSYYSGYDNQIHKDATPFYVDDWSWDTYLALHPLRTILNPSLETVMLQSYVRMYEQSGWMPTFPVLFGDHACMNGFHSSVTFLDAYRKGIRGFDVAKAYEGMMKNATKATMLPWRNGPKCELDDVYLTKGYFPALKKNEKETEALVHPFEKRQAVAVTLGHSYDDWAVSQLAKELGKNADAKTFEERGQNYKKLWHPEMKVFLPKDSKGDWIMIDPGFDGGKGGREYYDENNGYTYRWQVQQDIKGLRQLMGGAKAMEDTLDAFFRRGLGKSKYEYWYTFPDHTGNVGQYSMGNEPSFHIPYLYNYTGSPWKTQKRIRFLLDVWFKDNIFGVPGDEDGGGMMAFVVFSSMGFYPVTPGLPQYTVGSPVFSKVSIRLDNGKTFTVIAKDCSVVNKYIQRASFDGKEMNTPWFSHQQLVNGGTLELQMGPKPNKTWGAGVSE